MAVQRSRQSNYPRRRDSYRDNNRGRDSYRDSYNNRDSYRDSYRSRDNYDRDSPRYESILWF